MQFCSPSETTEPVAIVNEAFVKRFFKNDEDPLGQHFGLDLPENAGTFRIVGIVRDAKFAGFALRRPARPMFYVPLAKNVPYKDPLMKRIEVQSHFIGGLMLVTNASPGALERRGTFDWATRRKPLAGRTYGCWNLLWY